MDEILSEREIEIFVGEWLLVPSTSGKFEVTVNGELIFSKKQLGRHAEVSEIREGILKVLEPLKPPGFVMPEDD